MKSPHIVGKTYELTQENMNHLIKQLEYWKEEARYLNQLLDHVDNRAKDLVEAQNRYIGFLQDAARYKN